MENSKRIVFFDGVCNLCNGFVNFLMERGAPMSYASGHGEAMSFASLQGVTAARMLPQELRGELSTVVYFRDGAFLVRGQAIAGIFKDLGGVYKIWGALLGILPEGFVDFFYRSVAKRRYALFGKRDVCRLPDESEKMFFLP